MDRAALENHITSSVKSLVDNETQLKEFLKLCSYERGFYEELDQLAKVLNSIETDHEDRIFYFGVPPEMFLETAKHIHRVSGIINFCFLQI